MMNTMIRQGLILVVAISCGCASQTPTELSNVELELQRAKNDNFILQHAPIRVREAEKTVISARRAWEEENVEQTVALSMLAEEQLELAVRQAGQQAVAEVSREAHQAQELHIKDRKLAEERDRSHTLEQVAKHYKHKATRASVENEFLLKELEAQKTVNGMKVTFDSDVLFEVDRANFKAGGKRELKALMTFLRDNPSYAVTIEGHTDSTGDEKYNKKLSERRANAVKEYLVGQGAHNAQINALGMGEHYPLASNDSVAGRLQNRRVEIILSAG